MEWSLLQRTQWLVTGQVGPDWVRGIWKWPQGGHVPEGRIRGSSWGASSRCDLSSHKVRHIASTHPAGGGPAHHRALQEAVGGCHTHFLSGSEGVPVCSFVTKNRSIRPFVHPSKPPCLTSRSSHSCSSQFCTGCKPWHRGHPTAPHLPRALLVSPLAKATLRSEFTCIPGSSLTKEDGNWGIYFPLSSSGWQF